ncbi:MAG: tyrosine-type recombinase/integrase [Acidaminococcaceae bacterium]
MVKKLFYQRCVALNISNTTLQTYGFFFKNLQEHLKAQGITEIEQVDALTIGIYLSERAKKVKSISVFGAYRMLKTVFIFLMEYEYITVNPMRKVKKPIVSKRLPKTYTGEDVTRILHSFDTTEFIGLRNYTLMVLLFSTGLRKGETGLRLSDIDMVTGFITVIGKGDKERVIPISNGLTRTLKMYLRKREEYLQEHCKSSGYVFVSTRGGGLSSSALNNIFRVLKESLGLPKDKRVSAHIWRHTFAKSFLLNGGDIFTLQKILGHSSIETTRVYINLNDNEVKAQNYKFNPLDNSRWQYY